jgi:hypothetical protein
MSVVLVDPSERPLGLVNTSTDGCERYTLRVSSNIRTAFDIQLNTVGGLHVDGTQV